MQRQAITLGLFFLNAIWFAIFTAACSIHDRDLQGISATAAWLSFFVAVGHLLYPYRAFLTSIRNWWSRNL